MSKIAYGDFQTPKSLTDQITKLIKRKNIAPKSLIEPTCGEGNFLVTAIDTFNSLEHVLGFDINPKYIEQTKNRLKNQKLQINLNAEDFFVIDWEDIIVNLPQPILVIGNPPWVTNTELGSIGSDNLPIKNNFNNLKGIDAITGKSNFDISEWMLKKLFNHLNSRDAIIAVLCKTSVARKVLKYAWKNQIKIQDAEIYLVDAKAYFDASVDACLLYANFSLGSNNENECKIFSSIDYTSQYETFGYRDGQLIGDIANFELYKHLIGRSQYRWRSGIKHDNSRIMELEKEEGVFKNKFGDEFELEMDYLYPLLKSSDIANGAVKSPRKWLIVPQKRVGEKTSQISRLAPKTWDYLIQNEGLFNQRKSSVYKNKPRFSIFGVGDYSFSPWKIAISGMYKKLVFNIVGKYENKPFVCDDTCYFISCQTKEEAEFLFSLLNSDIAKSFFNTFIFWDDKRPVKVELLNKLNLYALTEELGYEDGKKYFIADRNLEKQLKLF